MTAKEKLVTTNDEQSYSYMCTVERAKAIILGIWLFSIIYNSPWLYLVDLKLNQTEYICNFRLNRDHFAYKVRQTLIALYNSQKSYQQNLIKVFYNFKYFFCFDIKKQFKFTVN